MTDTPPPEVQTPVPVHQQTQFYGEGAEYVNFKGIRYRLVNQQWVRLPDPPAEATP
jgi:hypothetical protein